MSTDTTETVPADISSRFARVWVAPADTSPRMKLHDDLTVCPGEGCDCSPFREVGYSTGLVLDDMLEDLGLDNSAWAAYAVPKVDSEAIARARVAIEHAREGFEAIQEASAAGASFAQAMAAFRASVHYSLQVQNPSDYYSLFGIPVEVDEAHPRNSLTIRYTRPAYGDPPRRRRGWTARDYRAARRAWGRRKRAWKRAGRPTVEHHLFMPNVTIGEAP